MLQIHNYSFLNPVKPTTTGRSGVVKTEYAHTPMYSDDNYYN